MLIKRFRRHCTSALFILFIPFSVNAGSLSLANSFLDLSSLSFSNSVDLGPPEYLLILDASNDIDSLNTTDFSTGDIARSLDTGSSSASAEIVDSIFADVLSIASSELGLIESGFSDSFVSALVPFYNENQNDINISADYNFFSALETESPGDYAASSHSIALSLFDENFAQIGESAEVSAFLEVLDGDISELNTFDTLSLSALALETGLYYLAFDISSTAIAESFALAPASVPEPSSLLLALIAIVVLWRIKLSEDPSLLRKTQDNV